MNIDIDTAENEPPEECHHSFPIRVALMLQGNIELRSTDGKKLRDELEKFAGKLDTNELFDRWLKDVKDVKQFNTSVFIYIV